MVEGAEQRGGGVKLLDASASAQALQRVLRSMVVNALPAVAVAVVPTPFRRTHARTSTRPHGRKRAHTHTHARVFPFPSPRPPHAHTRNDPQVGPSWDRPWLQTSLGDFWGRRWNLPASASLKHLAYDPMLEGAACSMSWVNPEP